MNLLDVFFKKSRIVDDIIDDITKNPESWYRKESSSLAKGDILLDFFYGNSFFRMEIDGRSYPCTVRDISRIKRVQKWWLRNAPLVNLRSNTLEG